MDETLAYIYKGKDEIERTRKQHLIYNIITTPLGTEMDRHLTGLTEFIYKLYGNDLEKLSNTNTPVPALVNIITEIKGCDNATIKSLFFFGLLVIYPEIQQYYYNYLDKETNFQNYPLTSASFKQWIVLTVTPTILDIFTGSTNTVEVNIRYIRTQFLVDFGFPF